MMKKKWEEMTRAERRVEVAKDVIRTIKAGKLVAGHEGYVDSRSIAPKEKEDDRAWARRLMSENKCTVCARGAMMLCKVAKHDGFDVKRIRPNYFGELEIGQDDTSQALSDCFSDHQLSLIECAYEWWGEWEFDAWCDLPANERMIKIMKNIIANEGTFKPKQLMAEFETADA